MLVSVCLFGKNLNVHIKPEKLKPSIHATDILSCLIMVSSLRHIICPQSDKANYGDQTSGK